jgi:hypothetical protein
LEFEEIYRLFFNKGFIFWSDSKEDAVKSLESDVPEINRVSLCVASELNIIIINFYYIFSVAERRAVWLCERRSLRKQQQVPGNVCSSF